MWYILIISKDLSGYLRRRRRRQESASSFKLLVEVATLVVPMLSRTLWAAVAQPTVWQGATARSNVSDNTLTTTATTRISFFFQITSRRCDFGRANALAHVMSSSCSTHCMAGSNCTLKCKWEQSDNNDDNKNQLLVQITCCDSNWIMQCTWKPRTSHTILRILSTWRTHFTMH